MRTDQVVNVTSCCEGFSLGKSEELDESAYNERNNNSMYDYCDLGNKFTRRKSQSMKNGPTRMKPDFWNCIIKKVTGGSRSPDNSVGTWFLM